MIAVSHMIEDAVRWRSEPALAGKIIAFVKSDSDKLHSLAEFDEVTTRAVSYTHLDVYKRQQLYLPIKRKY